MKKNYFMLAATTMMLAACAQTDVVNEIAVEETPQAISFETFANKQTRAENSSADYSSDLSSHHNTFEVYAYKNVSETKVFNDETVTSEDDKWLYSGQVYWDKSATEYNFYAAAPAADYWVFNEVNNTDGKVDQTMSYFTINSHEITDHNVSDNTHKYVEVFGDKAIDLMIAEKEQVANNSQQALFNSVHLDFIHILSRLNITVSKSASLSKQVVTLNSLTVCNVKNIGSFNENANVNSLNAGTHERWTPAANTTSYSSLLNEELSEAPKSGDAEYMLQSLVIPQVATSEDVNLAGPASGKSYTQPYFKITYTITEKDNNETVLSSEEFVAYYNLANAFGVESLAFNEGWQNTLNITINPTAITFTANAAVWADQENKTDTDTNESQDDLTIQ